MFRTRKQRKSKLQIQNTISSYRRLLSNNPQMYSQIHSPSISPKNLAFIPRSNFTTQAYYKERANILFDKLNSFKNNLENQKHQKFSEVLQELKSIENQLYLTETQKHEHFEKVLASFNIIDKEINQQNIEFNRFKKILENLMETTTRQCQMIFDKITKEFQNNQLSISKYIDFKIEAFILKNKGVWLEQDMFNFDPIKEELNYLKKEVAEYYKNQQKEVQKLKKQISENLEKQKEFLLNEMKRSDHDDIMAAIESVYADITKKVAQMNEKRQLVEKNVLSMIQNVIDSYVKDSNKFK